MTRFARVLMSVLLLAVAGFGAGCGFISEGKWNPDKFLLKPVDEPQ
jgi:hypothetical protein